MWPVATDGVAWSVCLSVCLLVAFAILAKTAEPIVIPFSVLTLTGQRYHVLHGGQDSPREGEFWGCLAH